MKDFNEDLYILTNEEKNIVTKNMIDKSTDEKLNNIINKVKNIVSLKNLIIDSFNTIDKYGHIEKIERLTKATDEYICCDRWDIHWVERESSRIKTPIDYNSIAFLTIMCEYLTNVEKRDFLEKNEFFKRNEDSFCDSDVKGKPITGEDKKNRGKENFKKYLNQVEFRFSESGKEYDDKLEYFTQSDTNNTKLKCAENFALKGKRIETKNKEDSTEIDDILQGLLSDENCDELVTTGGMKLRSRSDYAEEENEIEINYSINSRKFDNFLYDFYKPIIKIVDSPSNNILYTIGVSGDYEFKALPAQGGGNINNNNYFNTLLLSNETMLDNLKIEKKENNHYYSNFVLHMIINKHLADKFRDYVKDINVKERVFLDHCLFLLIFAFNDELEGQSIINEGLKLPEDKKNITEILSLINSQYLYNSCGSLELPKDVNKNLYVNARKHFSSDSWNKFYKYAFESNYIQQIFNIIKGIECENLTNFVNNLNFNQEFTIQYIKQASQKKNNNNYTKFLESVNNYNNKYKIDVNKIFNNLKPKQHNITVKKAHVKKFNTTVSKREEPLNKSSKQQRNSFNKTVKLPYGVIETIPVV